MAQEIKILTSLYQQIKTEKQESSIKFEIQIAHLTQKLDSSL